MAVGGLGAVTGPMRARMVPGAVGIAAGEGGRIACGSRNEERLRIPRRPDGALLSALTYE
jgi:hypothetical protein